MPTVVIGSDSTGVKLMTTPDNNPVNTVVVGVPQNGGGSGSGTVTSVAVSGSDGIGVSGSPITTSGTIALSLGDITPDSIAAVGTITGSNLSGTNTGDQDLSGLLVKANNLSDLVSASTARTNLGLGALATLATVGTAQIDNDAVAFAKLQNIATATLVGRFGPGAGDPQSITLGANLTLSGAGELNAIGFGAGDVVGPASATDGAVTLYDGTTGKLLKNSTLTVAGNNLTVTGTIGASNFSGTSSGTNTGDQDLSGLMVKASNLSDLTNAATARTNLGVSTTANIAASVDKNYVTDAQLVVIGNTSGTNSGNVTLAGENYLSLASQQITAAAINLSGSNATGTLAAARFPALTGDVTNTVGTLATTIANDAVTTAKILDANVTLAKLVDASGASILLGRGSAAGGGDWQEITLGANLTMTNQVLSASGGGGTPGGADGLVQYNDGGAFGGMSLASWNDATELLSLGTYTGAGNFVTVTTNASGGYGLAINTSSGSGIGQSISSGGNRALEISATSGQGVVATTTTGDALTLNTTTGKLFVGTSESSDTNVATRVLATFGHNSSGSVANNFGARIELQLESSTTTGQKAGVFQWDWLDATHAGRDSRLRIYTVVNGTETEVVRIGAAGGSTAFSLPALGAALGSGYQLLTIVSTSTGQVGPIPGTFNKKFLMTDTNGGMSNTDLRFGATDSNAAFLYHNPTASANNTAPDYQLVEAQFGAAALAGFGYSTKYTGKSSTTAARDMVRTSAIWVSPTDASRSTAFLVQTVDNAGSLTERLRVGGLATKLSGGLQLTKAAKTANYTMLESDTAITSDATSGAVTITLPPATLAGHIVHVKRIDASANNTTVSRAGADTIEGANTVTLAAQYESVTLIADGTATWYVISTT